MKRTFPQSERLKKKIDFKKVLGFQRKKVGRYIVLNFASSKDLFSRLGISASKKYGNAPERNRFKRIVREAYRHSKNNLPDSLHFVVRPRKFAKNARMQDIQKELIALASAIFK